MTEQVDWLPALIVLAIGAAVGAAIVWRAGRSRRAVPSAAAEELERRDARGEFDALIAQLRELEDLGSKKTPEQLALDRRDLELEAARTLRELERLPSRPATPDPAASAAADEPSPPSPWKGFLWGAASVGAVAVLIFFVAEGSSNREPSGSATGGMASAPPQGGPMVDLQGLRAAVEGDPENLDARMELAQALLFTQDLQGVFEQTQFVLSRNANHPRALSYHALVRLAMGDLESAQEMARRAVQIDPSNPEIVVHLAIIEVQGGNQAEAERLLEDAIRRFPADARTLERLLSDLRGSGGAVPPEGTPQPGATRGRVAVELTAGAGASARGGTVFIFARDADQPGGEPVAVRRVSVATLPAQVEITPADSMTGSLPGRLLIEARMDSDGDPRTVSAEDVSGTVEATPGSAVRIVLSRR